MLSVLRVGSQSADAAISAIHVSPNSRRVPFAAHTHFELPMTLTHSGTLSFAINIRKKNREHDSKSRYEILFTVERGHPHFAGNCRNWGK